MGLIRYLFSRYKYLLYSAFGNEEYFRVVSQLKDQGILYETVSKRNQNIHQSINHYQDVRYDFFVKEEDVHNAHQAILHRSSWVEEEKR